MRPLFPQIGASGGARVSRYADTYVFCAILGRLLSDGGASREVAVAGDPFRADALQLYLHWGQGAPGWILYTAGIGCFKNP